MASASDFDAAWYLANNPDVAAAGVDPFKHFQQYGILENRAPNAGIYDAATGRGAAPVGSWAYNMNMNSPSGGLLKDFGADYLANNPDVVAAIRNGTFTSAADHYNQFGKNEGRSWGSGYTTTLNPATGAATFGGSDYGKTLAMADSISGYTGGAQNGRPATVAGYTAPTTTPTGNVGGLGGLGGMDMQAQYQKMMQEQFAASQKAMTDMMSQWQSSFNANANKTDRKSVV